MTKLIGFVCALVFLQYSGNHGHEMFAKYKAVEAYEIRPGILMMPRLSDDGKVCEIGLEKRHYSPEIIYYDSDLSRQIIDQIADEIVPMNERGKRDTSLDGLTITAGHGSVTLEEYENVVIKIYNGISFTSRKREIEENPIAARIIWKNRKCHTDSAGGPGLTIHK